MHILNYLGILLSHRVDETRRQYMYLHCVSKMSSKSIFISLSYTDTKSVHFFLRHSVYHYQPCSNPLCCGCANVVSHGSLVLASTTKALSTSFACERVCCSTHHTCNLIVSWVRTVLVMSYISLIVILLFECFSDSYWLYSQYSLFIVLSMTIE